MSDVAITEIPVGDLISQIPGPEDGFPSPELAEHWRLRGCGIACVRMVLESFGTDPGPAWPLIDEGLQAGSYCDRGWIHQGLVDMAQRRGITGRAQRGTTADVAASITRGHLVIASVTVCFRGGQPHPSRAGTYQPGGHLVLVTGAAIDTGGAPTALRTHHPSATEKNNWPNHWVDHDTFAQSFSGAYILFHPNHTAR
ncbi:MAG: hypothetical protein GY939_19280 [Actinomycetia bacterium]|nr:hypothetical protein [Actinomycetes bacterium]